MSEENEIQAPTNELTSLVSYLNTLQSSEWWKYLVWLMKKVQVDITKTVMTPRTNQALLFNADEILKDRNEVLELIINLPSKNIKDLENKLFALAQNSKSTQQRIDEYGEKFIQQAKDAWLIK